MSDTRLAAPDVMRHGIAEAMMGGAVTMVAITVAHASLPELVPTPKVAPEPQVASPAILLTLNRPAAMPPPVLIAFAEPLPDGAVGSRFGLRQLPWELQARLHAGVDLIAPQAEPVHAAADGVVSSIGEDAGYGRFVELTHAEGLTTLYGHLSWVAPGIALGMAVKAGTAVGQLGSTGSSTGTHLHFEIHDRDGRPLNPELFLGHSFARARDLPLREGRLVPRGVRVAVVSRIPHSKQVMMQARLEEAAAQASEADGSEGATHTPLVRSHIRRHGRG